MIFYTPAIQSGQPHFFLDEDESKHAVRVLRLGAGDRVQLVDGRGGLYEAQILDPRPKGVTLEILSVQEEFGKLPYHLHLAVAPTKNMDRLEWLVEKATEIGIHEITPIICDRSERKEVKVERLEKVAISAMKQSLKAYLPVIHPATRFQNFLKQLEAAPTSMNACQREQRYIAHCEPGEKVFINAHAAPKQSVLIMIGPEGDFSPQEIEHALNPSLGFNALSLGKSRLRTETAGLAACMEVSLLNRH